MRSPRKLTIVLQSSFRHQCWVRLAMSLYRIALAAGLGHHLSTCCSIADFRPKLHSCNLLNTYVEVIDQIKRIGITLRDVLDLVLKSEPHGIGALCRDL